MRWEYLMLPLCLFAFATTYGDDVGESFTLDGSNEAPAKENHQPYCPHCKQYHCWRCCYYYNPCRRYYDKSIEEPDHEVAWPSRRINPIISELSR